MQQITTLINILAKFCVCTEKKQGNPFFIGLYGAQNHLFYLKLISKYYIGLFTFQENWLFFY